MAPAGTRSLLEAALHGPAACCLENLLEICVLEDILRDNSQKPQSAEAIWGAGGAKSWSWRGKCYPWGAGTKGWAAKMRDWEQSPIFDPYESQWPESSAEEAKWLKAALVGFDSFFVLWGSSSLFPLHLAGGSGDVALGGAFNSSRPSLG